MEDLDSAKYSFYHKNFASDHQIEKKGPV